MVWEIPEKKPVPIQAALDMTQMERWDWIAETYSLGSKIDLQGRLSKDELDRLAWLGLNDLFFMCTVICGYNKFGLTGLHFDLCAFLDGGARAVEAGDEWHGMVNLPREHYKTTASIARSVQRVATDPDACQLIASATLGQAHATSKAIRKTIENNEIFRRLYPYVIPDPEDWSAGQFSVLPRNRNLPERRESTVMSRSVGSSLEGYHFEALTSDDLVTKKNYNSDPGRVEVKEFYQHVQALLNKGGEEVINGTRFGDDDLYGWMMGEENETDIHVLFRAVQFKDENGEMQFEFPEEWDDKRLAGKVALMGPTNVSCQYFNDPLPLENRKFTEDSFRYRKHQPKDMTFYCGIDPTTGEGEDDCGIVVGGVSEDGTTTIVDELTDRWGPTAMIEQVAMLNEEYMFAEVRVETYGFQKTLIAAFEEWQEENGIVFPVVGESASKASKIVRIVNTVQPLYDRGRVYHMPHLRGGKLEWQLQRLGATKVNHLADALYNLLLSTVDMGYQGEGTCETKEPASVGERLAAGLPVSNDELAAYGPGVAEHSMMVRKDDYL